MAELKHVVQETKEYDKFQKLMANRDISRQHINSLKSAIQQHPEILQVQPILVNENMFIIDGQHRFQAAVELGLPVAYTVVRGIGIEVARSMNILQRKWGPRDFAKSYSMSGNKHYQEYLSALDDYELQHSIILFALGDSAERHERASKRFRMGLFETGDLAEGRKNLDRLLEIKDIIQVPMTNPLAYALIELFQNKSGEFSYKRLIDKLHKTPSNMLHRTTSKLDYLRMLEDIYNYDMGEKNRARLF